MEEQKKSISTEAVELLVSEIKKKADTTDLSMYATKNELSAAVENKAELGTSEDSGKFTASLQNDAGDEASFGFDEDTVYLSVDGSQNQTYTKSSIDTILENSIPTKFSQLDNDSGFLADENIMNGSDTLSPWSGTDYVLYNYKIEGTGPGTVSVVDAVSPPVDVPNACLISGNTSGNKYFGWAYPGLDAGTYTISAYFKTNNNTCRPFLGVYTTKWEIQKRFDNFNSNGEWVRFSYTFTLENDLYHDAFKFLFGIQGGTTGDVWICAPMINKGGLKAYSEKLEFDGNAVSAATDSDYGVIKTNSADGIRLNSDGQLEVDGTLGQFPDGGLYYPTNAEPTNVGNYTLMMTDGAKNLSLAMRTFGIMAGANVTCKSASAGATQYRVSNTQTNRFALFAAKGGRVAIDQTDATNNGTALITDISFANGDPISAYFGPTESSNDIIITVNRTVNPDAATTKLRVYGTSTANDVIVVGQGCGASGGKAISLGQSCFAGGNQCIAFGNSSVSTGNNSVAFGNTHLVNKQFCFAAGQGHDFTNGSNGTSAVGIASEISSDTAFAVGNGRFNTNGNITRSNALEVLKDGSVVLKSPNGTRWKIKVDDSGNLTTEAI